MNRLGNNPPPFTPTETFAPQPILRSTFFRRVQIGLAILGILIMVGGYLHANFAAKTAWGIGTLLWIWVGFTVVGLGALYLLHPAFLRSGMLLVWVAVLAIAFFVNWLIVFPLNDNGRIFVSALWPALLAVGYFIVGYFLDRRFWWLAGWEIFLAVAMFLFAANVLTPPDLIWKNRSLFFGYSTGIPLLIAALPIWKEHVGV